MKLPSTSGQELVKALKRAGFEVVSQRGSHIKIRKIEKDNRITLTIPNHKELKQGTFRAILKQANISLDQLLKLLR